MRPAAIGPDPKGFFDLNDASADDRNCAEQQPLCWTVSSTSRFFLRLPATGFEVDLLTIGFLLLGGSPTQVTHTISSADFAAAFDWQFQRPASQDVRKKWPHVQALQLTGIAQRQDPPDGFIMAHYKSEDAQALRKAPPVGLLAGHIV